MDLSGRPTHFGELGRCDRSLTISIWLHDCDDEDSYVRIVVGGNSRWVNSVAPFRRPNGGFGGHFNLRVED